MFPLDFEEFLYANGVNEFAIEIMKRKYLNYECLDEATHNKIMNLFKKYLIVGGLPDAVNCFIAENNVQKIREIQSKIHEYYAVDAAKYDKQNKLKITKIYDLVPSNMENKKKRVIVKDIESKRERLLMIIMMNIT